MTPKERARSEPADPWEGQGHGDLMIRLGAKMNRADPDSPLWTASPLSLGETRELFGVIADLSLRLREAAADQARWRGISTVLAVTEGPYWWRVERNAASPTHDGQWSSTEPPPTLKEAADRLARGSVPSPTPTKE